MLNLRARMYEPMAMRFNQRDLVAGNIGDTITINRYLYCRNNPLSFCDPLGTSVLSKVKSAVKSTAKAVKSTATAVAAKTVSTAAKVTAKVATTVSKVSTTVAKASTAVSNVAKNVAANSNSKIVKGTATLHFEQFLHFENLVSEFGGGEKVHLLCGQLHLSLCLLDFFA